MINERIPKSANIMQGNIRDNLTKYFANPPVNTPGKGKPTVKPVTPLPNPKWPVQQKPMQNAIGRAPMQNQALKQNAVQSSLNKAKQ